VARAATTLDVGIGMSGSCRVRLLGGVAVATSAPLARALFDVPLPPDRYWPGRRLARGLAVRLVRGRARRRGWGGLVRRHLRAAPPDQPGSRGGSWRHPVIVCGFWLAWWCEEGELVEDVSGYVWGGLVAVHAQHGESGVDEPFGGLLVEVGFDVGAA